MSKQFIVDVIKQKGKRIIVYSDAHANVCAFFDGDPEPILGDEVDCHVCADNEKRVKTARVEGMIKAVKAIEHLGVGDHTETQEQAKGFTKANLIAVVRLDKLIAELEAKK